MSKKTKTQDDLASVVIQALKERLTEPSIEEQPLDGEPQTAFQPPMADMDQEQLFQRLKNGYDVMIEEIETNS